MIVSDPEHAMDILKDTGYLCRMTSVIGVEVEDEVGNLEPASEGADREQYQY